MIHVLSSMLNRLVLVGSVILSFVFDDFVVAFLDLFVAQLVFVVSHFKKGTKPLLHVSRKIKQQPIFIMF